MKESYTEFTIQVIEVIKKIPAGKVMTYGSIASVCCRPGGARQVARILHSLSEKHNLPWFRVVNAQGQISLPPGKGHELQKQLLEAEGVVFGEDGSIDLKEYQFLGTI